MTERNPVILIVEDDPAQQKLLAYNVEREGFVAVSVENGEAARQQLMLQLPDLVILDWMIPHINGISLCKIIKGDRNTRHIPILMISARTEEEDRVRGLDSGADDYLTKPYSVAELLARVRALLRRSRPTVAGTRLTFQDIELDPVRHLVTRNDATIDLRPTEFRLLEAFIEHPGRVWSRQQLLDRVWGRNIYVEDRTVDVHVGRLRKALCDQGGSDPFRTVRGVGYSLG